jgi:hypothetical protein
VSLSLTRPEVAKSENPHLSSPLGFKVQGLAGEDFLDEVAGLKGYSIL